MPSRLLALAACLLLGASAAHADTIIKLGLGGDAAADIELSGGVLSTVDDGNAATTGDQQTNIEFLGFASSLLDQAVASFTLEGVTVSGAPMIVGDLVIQNLTGGTFTLYLQAANTVFLSAALGSSVLTGPVGGAATGAVFSTSFASTIPGGLLDFPLIDPDSISFSLSLTGIDGGAGLSVSGGGTTLDPFTAAATMSIAAEQPVVPEPNAAALLGLGAALLALLATPAQRTYARSTSARRRSR
jgi:hypothetical protein